MRKISELKQNECIAITTKKEAKAILKNLGKKITDAEQCINWYLCKTNIGFMYIPNPKEIILAASDFIKPKKSINKRLKALEKKVFEVDVNDIDVVSNEAEKELTELPEKWCVRDCKLVSYWASNKFGCVNDVNVGNNEVLNVSGNQYRFLDEIQKGYTEITIDQFKKWVLKQEEQPKEIDWSKPGQLVINDKNYIWLTTGLHKGLYFRAIYVKDGDSKAFNLGYASSKCVKDSFKIYSGEPITLTNT